MYTNPDKKYHLLCETWEKIYREGNTAAESLDVAVNASLPRVTDRILTELDSILDHEVDFGRLTPEGLDIICNEITIFVEENMPMLVEKFYEM